MRADDLGHPYDGPPVATRVVSLVPSTTEALATDRRGSLVAATDWCTHPPDLDVPRVRGTKNPPVTNPTPIWLRAGSASPPRGRS